MEREMEGNLAVIDQGGPEGALDITPEDILANRVVKYNVTFAQIAKLRDEYAVVPEDLSIKENYAMVKKTASHLRGLRTDVEKRRKELNVDALAYTKRVNGAAKELTEQLTAIEEPFATAKKDYDTAEEIRKREIALAEERRIDGIAERIATIKALPAAHISSDSATIKAILDRFESDDTPYIVWAQEFADKAEIATRETIAKLEELHDIKLQQETFAKQQAEAEAKRLADEEAARVKREVELEAERARLETERAAMAAEVAAMRKAAEELAAIQKAKDDEREAAAEKERLKLVEEQAERDRIAEKDRAKLLAEIEAMKKAQEVKETPVVEPVPVEVPVTTRHLADKWEAGNAMFDIIGGDKAITKTLLDAIICGEIPYITFTGAM
jgi:hypothetical protein